VERLGLAPLAYLHTMPSRPLSADRSAIHPLTRSILQGVPSRRPRPVRRSGPWRRRRQGGLASRDPIARVDSPACRVPPRSGRSEVVRAVLAASTTGAAPTYGRAQGCRGSWAKWTWCARATRVDGLAGRAGPSRSAGPGSRRHGRRWRRAGGADADAGPEARWRPPTSTLRVVPEDAGRLLGKSHDPRLDRPDDQGWRTG
jgi:hypothetical protein